MNERQENRVIISNNINTDVNINSKINSDIYIDRNINTDINIGSNNFKDTHENQYNGCCRKRCSKETLLSYIGYISVIAFLFIYLIRTILGLSGDLETNISINSFLDIILFVFSSILVLFAVKLLFQLIQKSIRNKILLNILWVLIAILAVNLILFLLDNQLRYYFLGIVGIGILVAIGEILIESFIRGGEEDNEVTLSILKNILYIIIAFAFVGIAANKIDGLGDVNKRERAIWSVYETSYRALEGIEKNVGFIDLDKEENIKEDIKVNNGDEIIKVISNLQKDINLTANRYIDYIDDNLYKNVSQIINEANRYIDKLNNIDENGLYLPKEFLNNLIKELNEATEPWYDLYENKIKWYNKKYNVDTRAKDNYYEGKNKGYELRKLRVDNEMFIEEVCYKIDFLEKYKEITYRLIEAGKINPIESHYEKIKEILVGNKAEEAYEEEDVLEAK